MEQRISRSRASLPANAHSVPEPQTTTPATREAQSIAPQRPESAAPPESVESVWDDVLKETDLAEEEALQEMMEGSVTDVMTGAYTPGATTEDLSSSLLRGGQQIGGPSGGDVYGAGRNRKTVIVDEAEFVSDDTHAIGIDQPLSTRPKNTGMAAKIASENTAALLKGLWPNS